MYVTVSQLSEALEQDGETVRNVVHQLMEQYNDEKRGIRIIEIEDG